MKMQFVEKNTEYGIRITHENGVSGWLTGPGGKVSVYPTEQAAKAALNKLLKSKRYSWKCTVEVAEFHGFPRNSK